MKASSLCCCCLMNTSDKDLKTPYNRLGITEILSEMLEECFQIHLIQDSNEEHGICSVCVGRLRDASDFKLQVQRSQATLRALLEGPISVSDLDQLHTKMAEDDRTSCEPLLHVGVVVKTEPTDDVLYEPIGSEVKSEVVEGDETTDMLYEPGSGVKSEVIEDAGRNDVLLFLDQDYISNSNQTTTDLEEPSNPTKSEKSDDAPIDEDFPSFSGAGAPSLRTYSRRRQPAPTCPVRLEPLSDKVPSACQTWPNTCDLESSPATHDDIFVMPAEATSHSNRHKLNSLKHDECYKETRNMRIHMKVKSYFCEICNKKFLSEITLSRHKITHTALKPLRYKETFICDICDKQFKRRKYLVQHMITHREHKLFSCEVCNKKFIRKQYVSDHKKIHTGLKPFCCEICNKKFTLKSNLVKHIQLHTGHKPFTCDFCGAQFSRKYSLILHIRKHTKQRPYVCEICNKKFSSNSGLFRHKKTHTAPKYFRF